MKNYQNGFAGSKSAVIIAAIVLIGAAAYCAVVMRKHPSSEAAVPSPIAFSQLFTAKIPDLTVDSDPQTFTLSNGQYSGTMKQGEAEDAQDLPFLIAFDTATSSYAYGDIDGDGVSDIAAIIGENTGGTGYFDYLAVFANKGGVPTFAAYAYLGDRIMIKKVSVSKGVIAVDFITQGPNEPMCCGTLPKTLSFSMVGGKLVEVK
ncbi:MAG: hypothetical protein JWO73_677 [Candidatus Taylorbacteria bacterium]|nr:hypothetical protein [Candidatus Taylorbacteria bacterium]